MKPEQAIHGTIGLAKVTMGIGKASYDIVKKRKNICNACPKIRWDESGKIYEIVKKIHVLSGILTEDAEGNNTLKVPRCTVCNCFINAKVLLKSEQCKDEPSKWGKEE